MGRTAMYDTELAFFIKNQDALTRQYGGKVLVLRGEDVVGVYDTPLQADLEAQKLFPVGTYAIQRCIPGADAYTVRIANAFFA